MNVSQLVLERLDTTGWQKKQSGGALGPNCLTGALAWSTFDNEEVGFMAGFMEGDLYDLWRDVIREQFPERVERVDGGTTIVKFNDHPDTTFDDVRLILEKAILIEDERQISASRH